jgi:hypothetical protein
MAYPDTNEIIWASGLFEGEGCITMSQGKHIRLQLNSTDEDVVRRFHKAVNVGMVEGPMRAHTWPTKWKSQWRWRCSNFEHCQAVVALLWNGLGRRRRHRAKELLLLHRGYL